MRFQGLCGLLVGLAAGAALGCDTVGEKITAVPVDESFDAALNGAQRVPSVTTTATGTALFAVVSDSFLAWRVDVAYPDTAALRITRAHVHAAAAGVNGGVVLILLNLTSPRTLRSFRGQVAAGQLKRGVLDTAAVRYDSLLTLFRSGNAYVDVHSTADTGSVPGVIRGQIQLQ
jgi:hypothetical protein